MTITETIKQAVAQLSATSTSPRIDAEILLCKTLQVSRAYLYTHPEFMLTKTTINTFETLLNQRLQGYPIAYLIGTREFWSMPITVSPATLIPRPETELLVEKVLTLFPDDAILNVLELGTGSGAIACALAKSRPHWKVMACDISQDALIIAKQNAKTLDIYNIQFLQSDWFSDIPRHHLFHVIVANPPYLAESDPHLQTGDVRFEPKQALISGSNGLESLQFIIEHSYNRLIPNGYLLLEHGCDQKNAVSAMLLQYRYQAIHCWQDYQGHDRVSSAKKLPAAE